MINISALTSSSSSSSSSKKRARTTTSASSSASSSSLSSAHSSSSNFSKLSDDTIELLRNIHPSEYAKAAFTANGFDESNQESIAKQCETRFIEAPTSEMLEAYGTEIVMAVRNNDLAQAKALFYDTSPESKFNKGCNACNRFGESILHIACRRGHLDMVQFLVQDVGLSIINIRDDYHRTPLHDAFWTSKASYDVVDFLLNQPNVTELLLCKDRRGYTPLDYSRGEDRGKWLRFLWERKAQLRPSPSTILATCCSAIVINSSSTSNSTSSITEDELS